MYLVRHGARRTTELDHYRTLHVYPHALCGVGFLSGGQPDEVIAIEASSGLLIVDPKGGRVDHSTAFAYAGGDVPKVHVRRLPLQEAVGKSGLFDLRISLEGSVLRLHGHRGTGEVSIIPAEGADTLDDRPVERWDIAYEDGEYLVVGTTTKKLYDAVFYAGWAGTGGFYTKEMGYNHCNAVMQKVRETGEFYGYFNGVPFSNGWAAGRRPSGRHLRVTRGGCMSKIIRSKKTITLWTEDVPDSSLSRHEFWSRADAERAAHWHGHPWRIEGDLGAPT